jgi:hypothetical protein
MNRTRIYCNECEKETWHIVTTEHQQSHYDRDWGFDRLLHGQILSCCGCDYLSFRLFQHPLPFEKNGKVLELILPLRNSGKRKRIYIFWTLSERIKNLYGQTIGAYDNKLYLLSVIGLRALLEAIVVDRLDPSEYSSSIKSKIEALRKYFSAQVIDTLQEFRFMGNQAVHSLLEPDGGDVHRALNVIEDIMIFFYGVEDKVKVYKSGKDSAPL